MNAPFNPGRNGLRDAFVAYVCDDDTATMLQPVVSEMGWQIEKINKGGLRNAVQSLAVSASPNILFVDLSESGDPLNDINALAEVCEPGTVVIAAGQVNDVRLYRDLLSSGIQDYLLKPFSTDQLRDAIAHAQAIFNAPKHVDHAADRPRLLTAIVGARGGVGASTLATSIAWLLGQRTDRSTALLDLDIHFGTGALGLDLEPGRGLTDAIENPSRIDGLFIDRALVKANDKLSILSAEAPLNQVMLTDGTAFFQLQEELRSAFDATVVDMPRSMMIQYPHLMGDMNTVIVVTELTLAAARDMIRILSWLRSNAPQCQVLIVANRMGANAGEINRKDFENSIERKVDFVVPFDAKTAAQAAKLGQALVETGKSTKTAQAIIEVTNALVASVEDGESPSVPTSSASAKKKSLLAKLADFKSKSSHGEEEPTE